MDDDDEYPQAMTASMLMEHHEPIHEILPSTKEHLSEEIFHDAQEQLIFRFMSLPYDIRVGVYSYLIQPSRVYKRRTVLCLRDRPKILDVMLASRFLYREVTDVLRNVARVHIFYLDDLTERKENSQRILKSTDVILQNIHPVLRKMQHVCGSWRNRYTETRTWQLYPTVPLTFIHENSLMWKTLEMQVSIRLNNASRDFFKLQTEDTLDRLKVALAQTRRFYVDIMEYVHYGRSRDLRVTVLFEVEDKQKGCHVCNVRMEASKAVVLTTREWLMEDEVISVFQQAFDRQQIEIFLGNPW